MSLVSSRARRAATLVAGAMLISSPSAVAAPTTRTAPLYCTWADQRGGGTTLSGTTPDGPTDTRAPQSVTLAITDDSRRLTELGLAAVEGTATFNLRTVAGGKVTRSEVKLTLPRTATTASRPTTLTFDGQLPAIDKPGAVVISFEQAALDLRGYDASGNAVAIPNPALTRNGTVPYAQPDADPTTFSVPCDSNVVQSRTLAAYMVGSMPIVPFGAPDVVSLDVRGGAVAVDWNEAAGTFPVAYYSAELINKSGEWAGESRTQYAGPDDFGTIFRSTAGASFALALKATDALGTTVPVLSTGSFRVPDVFGPTESASFFARSQLQLPSVLRRATSTVGLGTFTYPDPGIDVTGNLTLLPFDARLQSGGVNVIAKVQVERVGATTGTYTNGVLRLGEQVNLRILSATVQGSSIPVGTCRTKAPTTLALSSGPVADLSVREPLLSFEGKLTAPFPVTTFENCGLLGSVFKPVPELGNGTISVTLAPN